MTSSTKLICDIAHDRQNKDIQFKTWYLVWITSDSKLFAQGLFLHKITGSDMQGKNKGTRSTHVIDNVTQCQNQKNM